MKRIIVFLLLLSVLFCTAGCGAIGNGGSEGQGDDGSDEGGGETERDNRIINSDSEVMIICGTSDGARIGAEQLLDAINEDVTNGEGRTYIGSVYHNRRADNEITVGYVAERELSVRANEELAKMPAPDGEYDFNYLVITEGGDVAIAYQVHNIDYISETNQIVEKVVAEFLTKYVKWRDEIILGDGEKMSGSFNVLEMIEERDAALVNEAWEKLRLSTTPEIYEAIRTYYTIIDDRVVDWMANLYDPVYGNFYATTSGFYASGIYPNIEATKQVLGFLHSSGMTTHVGYENGFTKMMEYRLVYYIKSIQDENGYFYLPQMTKNQINSHIGRRARDLGNCMTLLQAFGEHPVYDTPLGHLGDGITADEYWASLGISEPPPVIPKLGTPKTHLSASLGTDKVSAVSYAIAASDVIFAADDGTSYLKSHKAFAAYLNSLNIDASPYSYGNELGESTAQIRSYSDKLGKYKSPDGTPEQSIPWYEGMTLADMTIAFLDSHINEQGLFGKNYLYDNNPKTVGCEFENSNGTMKLLAVYNGLKYPYKEPVLATRGLLRGIMSDEVSNTNICEVFNIWCALERVIQNVMYCSTDSAVKEQVISEIRATFEELGAEAILNTYQKQKRYQKPDGAFSHEVNGSATHHQGGLPVGLGGNEGNIDAIGFGGMSTLNAIFYVMGLSGVPFYTESDYVRFMMIIRENEKRYLG